ncbi:MAG: hypothetical protein Alpg2KO_17210 [Alphaproteobacteria bacterium]
MPSFDEIMNLMLQTDDGQQKPVAQQAEDAPPAAEPVELGEAGEKALSSVKSFLSRLNLPPLSAQGDGVQVGLSSYDSPAMARAGDASTQDFDTVEAMEQQIRTTGSPKLIEMDIWIRVRGNEDLTPLDFNQRRPLAEMHSDKAAAYARGVDAMGGRAYRLNLRINPEAGLCFSTLHMCDGKYTVPAGYPPALTMPGTGLEVQLAGSASPAQDIDAELDKIAHAIEQIQNKPSVLPSP